MKLELKHIAPYLPYGLKVKITNDSGVNFNLIGLEHDMVLYGKHSWYRTGGNIEKCKPILRPISKLTKEIEVNSEKFIPIFELAKIIWETNAIELHPDRVEVITRYKSPFNINSEYKTLSFRENSFVFSVLDDDFKIIGYFTVPNQLDLFQKLFEWHFDVFGLIEQGLAIDINTL